MPPGSVMKALTLLAGLEAGVITPAFEIDCQTTRDRHALRVPPPRARRSRGRARALVQRVLLPDRRAARRLGAAVRALREGRALRRGARADRSERRRVDAERDPRRTIRRTSRSGRGASRCRRCGSRDWRRRSRAGGSCIAHLFAPEGFVADRARRSRRKQNLAVIRSGHAQGRRRGARDGREERTGALLEPLGIAGKTGTAQLDRCGRRSSTPPGSSDTRRTTAPRYAFAVLIDRTRRTRARTSRRSRRGSSRRATRSSEAARDPTRRDEEPRVPPDARAARAGARTGRCSSAPALLIARGLRRDRVGRRRARARARLAPGAGARRSGSSSSSSSCSIPYQRLLRLAPPVYAALLLALVLVLAIGPTINGSQRWLMFGGVPFQPSEALKLVAILLLARLLRFGRELDSIESWLPALVLTLLPVALIMKQPDLGTSLVYVPVGLALLFVSGIPVRSLVVLGVLGVAIARRRVPVPAAPVPEGAHPEHGVPRPARALRGEPRGLPAPAGALRRRGRRVRGPGARRRRGDAVRQAAGEPQRLHLRGDLGGDRVPRRRRAARALPAPRRGDPPGRDPDARSRGAPRLRRRRGARDRAERRARRGLARHRADDGMPLPFVSYGGSALLTFLVAIAFVLNVSCHPGGMLLPAMRSESGGLSRVV